MHIYDLNKMEAFPYEQRDKNVFFESRTFKTRLIVLQAGESIPECQMPSYVMFIVLKGEAIVTVDAKEAILPEGACLITEPAILELHSDRGVRILGIQIKKE
jgi:quercetin dioxygenase-like cupin family protein